MSDEIRTEQLDDEKEHERLRKIVEEKMPPEDCLLYTSDAADE